MADRDKPASPPTRRGLLVRTALYVVSFSLWLVLALFSRNHAARICGAIACALNVLIVAGYIRRYRRLGRAEPARK